MEFLRRLTGQNVKRNLQLESPVKHTLSQEFIPVGKFSRSHLPSGYKDKMIVKLIKALSSLTVITFVEPKSHRFQTGQTDPDKRQCTGFVDDVVWLHGHSLAKCGSDVSNRLVATINVLTDRRVLLDTVYEDFTVTCHLSYKEGSASENLGCFAVVKDDVDRDACLVKSTTCDEKLARRLEKYVCDFNRLWREVHKKYRDLNMGQKLVIIVSHPRGQAQHVSMGYLKETCSYRDGTKSRLEYSTPVEPGSEGAHVLLIGG